MTTQEFKTKKQSICESHKAIINEARERVEEFVTDILGAEWKVLGFCENGFEVQLMRDEKRVFGASWEIFIDRDFLGDKEVRVRANIGTCGSFEIGASDDQEKKYMAFARFMSMLEECGMKKVLIKCYKDETACQRAYRKLVEEFENQ